MRAYSAMQHTSQSSHPLAREAQLADSCHTSREHPQQPACCLRCNLAAQALVAESTPRSDTAGYRE